MTANELFYWDIVLNSYNSIKRVIPFMEMIHLKYLICINRTIYISILLKNHLVPLENLALRPNVKKNEDYVNVLFKYHKTISLATSINAFEKANLLVE